MKANMREEGKGRRDGAMDGMERKKKKKRESGCKQELSRAHPDQFDEQPPQQQSEASR